MGQQKMNNINHYEIQRACLLDSCYDWNGFHTVKEKALPAVQSVIDYLGSIPMGIASPAITRVSMYGW